jgi:hypothetical protein
VQFLVGKRIDPELLWREYQQGKQTYLQLSRKHKCSIRTIQRKIDLYLVCIESKQPKRVVVLMDTTYWGRSFGVMLFKDAISKENLLKYYVRNETNQLYLKGVKELVNRGYTVIAIVSDGRKGLVQSFGAIPVQMCQFHQVAIIRRYITKNPKLPASIELKELTLTLKLTDKESFTGALDEWFLKWRDFLNERTTNLETGKSYYTHKRLRSAYRSLKSNLPWLFTWYDHIELNIPNTTNAIDGHFADLKNKLRNHNGLSVTRKMKFIDAFLKV